MDVKLSRTLVRQSMHQPWVRVEVEYDRSVIGEYGCPLGVGQTVGVINFRDEFEEVNDVDESDFEIW